MPKWSRVVLLLAGLAAALVISRDRLERISWVGSTRLTIEFVVTDAETGQPVEGAVIFAIDELDPRNTEQSKAKTNGHGIARIVFPDQMAYGMQSGLGFTHTYAVRIPSWHLRARAPGYAEPELVHIYEISDVKSVERTGPGEAKLVVPMTLRKSQK